MIISFCCGRVLFLGSRERVEKRGERVETWRVVSFLLGLNVLRDAEDVSEEIDPTDEPPTVTLSGVFVVVRVHLLKTEAQCCSCFWPRPSPHP